MAGEWLPHARYGALGLPLAFVALPLYVLVPAHYASTLGVSLAAVGALLLVSRLLDAFIDPALGRWADRCLARSGATSWRAWSALVAIALVCILGFWAVFLPAVHGPTALLWWCGLAITTTTVAYSACTILHQTWGSLLGGDASARAAWVAWREGLGMVGVVVANVVAAQWGPVVLACSLSLTMALALWGLKHAPWVPATARHEPIASAGQPTHVDWLQPWRHQTFRRLLLLYMVNGIAASVPATLVVFFIRDVVQRPDATAAFLALYFVAGALSVPVWARAVGRWGPSRAWAVGMVGHVLAFSGVCIVGPGDVGVYAVVCLFSGVMLGADLTAPGTLLAGVIQHTARVESAGLFTGWWQMATKLNLALAAGLALPMLQVLGYRTGVPDAASQQALVWVYGVVPCLFKAMAFCLWWRLWARKGWE
jgi:Na+/melibiose symporter-like transporter